MIFRMTAVLLLAAASQVATAQEVAYVTDILRLGIHHAEDTSDSPFRNLISGTELTILERNTNYARVKTPEGEEGWVKAAYLVTDKPAQLRVAEMEAKVAELENQLHTAQSARMVAETEANRATKEVAANLNSADAIRDTLARLQQQNEEFEGRLEQYRGAIPWTWVAGALVVALGGGFVAGIWWLDHSIRRRFGGFRIY